VKVKRIQEQRDMRMKTIQTRWLTAQGFQDAVADKHLERGRLMPPRSPKARANLAWHLELCYRSGFGTNQLTTETGHNVHLRKSPLPFLSRIDSC
jgi:hypothetical protein